MLKICLHLIGTFSKMLSVYQLYIDHVAVRVSISVNSGVYY